ncbi:MAG: putative amidohydrolase [Psychromonas sp.]|jgi:predicted amidohydrolase|uniref:carbon-nitrogen hydrolase family protein n=1 Tax=Psychromonas sp. TaxID=1884585 RepID=UPI0039E53A08
MSFNLSAIQMLSVSVASENITRLELLLAALSPVPGQLVLLPENALCIADKKHYLGLSENLGQGYYQSMLSALAKRYQCYLVCGSFPIKSPVTDKIFTTCLVFSPSGELLSHYHKMHLFDARVADQKGLYKESDTFIPGQEVKLFNWQCGAHSVKVGLTICYDLRFPGLFQTLRQQGADIILVPAAFTQTTGEAHWLPLLQARAIENQCYIIAANQSGREKYGHSMIISPWGEVLEQLKDGEGSIHHLFEKSQIEKIRQAMPILEHNRFTTLKV